MSSLHLRGPKPPSNSSKTPSKKAPDAEDITVEGDFDGLLAPHTPNAPKAIKRRRALTETNRKLIREYYFETCKRNYRQQAVCEWYLEWFGRSLTQSIISDTFSNKYRKLDKGVLTHPNAKRIREGVYPDIEAILFQWFQCVILQGLTVTSNLLKERAQQVYENLPQYNDAATTPHWSTG